MYLFVIQINSKKIKFTILSFADRKALPLHQVQPINKVMENKQVLEVPNGLIAQLATSMQDEVGFLREEAFICEAYDAVVNLIWDADNLTQECLMPLKTIARYRQMVKELSKARIQTN